MGTFLSILSEQLPPKSKFAVEDIPDLSGKVMIVTGGNTGIVFDPRYLLLTGPHILSQVSALKQSKWGLVVPPLNFY